MPSDEPIIALTDASVRLGDRRILEAVSWRIQPKEHWAVLGPNGAGKSTLAKALAGTAAVVQGRIHRSATGRVRDTALVSFETHRRLLEREAFKAEMRSFSGRSDAPDEAAVTLLDGLPETLPREIGRRRLERLARTMGLEIALKRPLEALSGGEVNRLLIARALVGRPRLLILDEPFDGLDHAAAARMGRAIDRLASGGSLQLVLITHRFGGLMPCISHVLFLRNGRVATAGPRHRVFTPACIRQVFSGGDTDTGEPELPAPLYAAAPPVPRHPLVAMHDVQVRYGQTRVLHGLNWELNPGENWAVVGPPGAGKTTLLDLVDGTHLQAYSNDIRLFDRRRGTGESIWDLRRRIGRVGSTLQMRYPQRFTVEAVACSGFFDTVGLFRRCPPDRRRHALAWLTALGIAHLAERPFGSISQGQRQLALIARAMVKSPALLLLDEPDSGLDWVNRERVRRVITRLAALPHTHVVVTATELGEVPEGIADVLQLSPPDRIEPPWERVD